MNFIVENTGDGNNNVMQRSNRVKKMGLLDKCKLYKKKACFICIH